MMPKLFKTKWYIVDLDTQQVDTSRYFDRCFDAIDTVHEDGSHKCYTAYIGKHILKHTDTWIIPPEIPSITPCIECGEPASVSLPCGNAVCEGCWERYGPTGCSTCDGHATWCTFAK